MATKNDIDVIEHYDKLADENNDPVHDSIELKKYMDNWDGKIFIDKLDLSKSKSVLEIGVGTGRLAVKTAEKCKEFVGIDISPKTVELAKINLSKYNNVNLICGNFLDYSFDEKFDVIYSSLTFMHIKDKKKAILKIANLLKLNGVFVLSIDKHQDKFIDMGSRKIRIYPDNLNDIIIRLKNSGLILVEKFDTKFANIVISKKSTI